MDTSDPSITFDVNGVCSHCREFDEVTSKRWFPNKEGERRLEAIAEKIRTEGRGQEYDCIMGLSGGVDSSYLALAVKDLGLRPLVVHVDAGWNSELAVHNIEQIIKYCDYELFTHVLNWEEVRDLQVAYLKAGIANQDVPQDHAFFAALYQFSVRNNIRFVLSGGNIATESVFPSKWHHAAMDAINLKAIHKRYGRLPLRHYSSISLFDYYFYYPFIKKMTTVRPLNYMPYDLETALGELKEKVGYKEYGRKHGESRFTKFFQNHYLPVKFGYDKRRPHLASKVLSGLITREQAEVELTEALYDNAELIQDKEYVAKKLGLSVQELDDLTAAPPHYHDEYPNWDRRFRFLKKVQSLVERAIGRGLSNYS